MPRHDSRPDTVAMAFRQPGFLLGTSTHHAKSLQTAGRVWEELEVVIFRRRGPNEPICPVDTPSRCHASAWLFTRSLAPDDDPADARHRRHPDRGRKLVHAVVVAEALAGKPYPYPSALSRLGHLQGNTTGHRRSVEVGAEKERTAMSLTIPEVASCVRRRGHGERARTLHTRPSLQQESTHAPATPRAYLQASSGPQATRLPLRRRSPLRRVVRQDLHSQRR